MAELIQRIRPTLQPHALRNAMLALAAGALVMAGLATLSTWWAPTRAWWDGGAQMVAGLQASGLAALATAVGALPIFLVRQLSKRHEAGLLSFSAGVMLAAAFFSLLLPALDAGSVLLSDTTRPAFWGAVAAGLGLGLGVVLMLQMDHVLPHEHPVQPPHAAGHAAQNEHATLQQRAWLMVLALTLHNIPEGLAMGAAYAGFGDGADATTGGPSVALAIGLQNMPEGMIVAMALRTLGHTALRAWGIAGLSGLAEPLGAWLGLVTLGSLPALYPLGLAMAAGAMLFVVSHEIIPETHRNGHETLATGSLVAGFVFMLLLNTAFVG